MVEIDIFRFHEFLKYRIDDGVFNDEGFVIYHLGILLDTVRITATPCLYIICPTNMTLQESESH